MAHGYMVLCSKFEFGLNIPRIWVHLDSTLEVVTGVIAIYRFMWELRVGSGPRETTERQEFSLHMAWFSSFDGHKAC